MPLTISRKQRDAIYELVVDHLASIGDVWIEPEKRDHRDLATWSGRQGRVISLRALDPLGSQ